MKVFRGMVCPTFLNYWDKKSNQNLFNTRKIPSCAWISHFWEYVGSNPQQRTYDCRHWMVPSIVFCKKKKKKLFSWKSGIYPSSSKHFSSVLTRLPLKLFLWIQITQCCLLVACNNSVMQCLFLSKPSSDDIVRG